MSLFVAGAAFGEVHVSLFVAGAVSQIFQSTLVLFDPKKIEVFFSKKLEVFSLKK